MSAEIILVAIQKGGVYKSSVTSAIGGELASKGRKVLIIDGDLQGNATRRDLGVAGDLGKSLSMAMTVGYPLQPERARENLDVIAGGMYLASVPSSLPTLAAQSGAGDGSDLMAKNLGEALEGLIEREGYTDVLIDAGPGDVLMLNGYMTLADWLLIPTHEDNGSLDGVFFMEERMQATIRRGNQIDILGVVMTGVNPQATRRNAAAVEKIAKKFGTPEVVFDAMIRHQQALATDLRAHSLVPADFHSGEFERRVDSGELKLGDLWSRDVTGLVGDYQDLTVEMVRRLIEAKA